MELQVNDGNDDEEALVEFDVFDPKGAWGKYVKNRDGTSDDIKDRFV